MAGFIYCGIELIVTPHLVSRVHCILVTGYGKYYIGDRTVHFLWSNPNPTLVLTHIPKSVPNLNLKAVVTGTVPYPLLETLQVRYRIFSRKPLEYGTESMALYTTDTEPYL